VTSRSGTSALLAHAVQHVRAMAAVIQTHDLTKVFRTDEIETHALAGIDLAVEENDYLAIVGPSGSGKSTLLAILGLMDLPTAGTFLWRGEPVGALGDTLLSARRNREVGFIFQTFNLIGDLSVERNVELPLVYRGVAARARRDKVAAVLERVGMGHRARHFPSQLSGGQQQRVAVARALVGEPSILLADEPTGNLDSVNGESTMDLIDELHASGSTVCMVTHNLDYAQRAKRLIRLSDGHIVEERV
jgi:putative ABC transport system ATP-binding protein